MHSAYTQVIMQMETHHLPLDSFVVGLWFRYFRTQRVI